MNVQALNPLQVRFAEGNVEKDIKLFVGMLPKTFAESELHRMFQPYGDIKEIHIIRGTDGSPKGCAFIKFGEKTSALAAIDNLHETIPAVSQHSTDKIIKAITLLILATFNFNCCF